MSIDIQCASLFLVIGCFTSSIFISRQPSDSVMISLITVVHLLLYMSVYHLSQNSSLNDQGTFIQLLGFGLFALAVMTAVRFAFPPPASQVFRGAIEWPSALPGFISVRHFGSWTGAVCAAFLAVLLTNERGSRLSWAHLFYFVSAGMTVWSGTRAAILALVVTSVVVLIINKKIPKLQSLAVLATLTGAAMMAAWLLLPSDNPEFRLFITSDLGNLGNADQMTSGRMSLWGATLHRWLESPLLGWGSGSVFWEVFIGWRHTQPHNAVLQFLISWGLVGAAGALWLLGRAIIGAHRQAIRHIELLPLLAILDVLLIMSLLEGMLHYPRFIMLIMILFAAILSYRNSSRISVHSN